MIMWMGSPIQVTVEQRSEVVSKRPGPVTAGSKVNKWEAVRFCITSAARLDQEEDEEVGGGWG